VSESQVSHPTSIQGRRLVSSLLLVCCLALSFALQAQWNGEVSSPDGLLKVQVGLDEQGRLSYQLFHHGTAVIRTSPLGICRQDTCFEQGLSLESTPLSERVTDSYRLWTGKQRYIDYQANQLLIGLVNRDGQALRLNFRLSDDGLAYRYEFPGESDETLTVTSELSGTHFFPGTRAWLQPKAEAQSGWRNTNPSYEEDYRQHIEVGTPAPGAAGWVYPALFHFEDTWIVLSETGMDGHYCGTSLAADSTDGLYRVHFPQPPEVTRKGDLLPVAKAPFNSPWRLVLAGDLATIVNSTLGTDLAVPTALDETGFIEPGISAWSWGLLKDDATVYPVQHDFIDYAARMNWPYVLVDADWDQKIGYEKIAELADYAAGKGVGLLLWYNSSGGWNQTVFTPKSRLLTRQDRRSEFARLHAIGIRGIKVDFFPGDGRSVMAYYQDILRDAADFELLVNFHGATLPRGMQRTWPNLMTMEAVKGFEFITFVQENADREATHSAMLPFTRNLFDPMDFTPMVLGDIPDRERRTTNGFQLALTVLFTSGIQHLVTTPEQMREMPEFVLEYLRTLPGQWDESRFIDGYPGKYVVIARRSGDRWYLAGINGSDTKREISLDMSDTGATRAQLIEDGQSPRDLVQTEVAGAEQAVTLAPGAGFVLIFHP